MWELPVGAGPARPGQPPRTQADNSDQNDGVELLYGGDVKTPEELEACLSACMAREFWTGCEAIWDQSNRGCWVHTMEVDHGNLYPYNHACWINGKDDPAPPSSTELRDSSGNYLFTLDPAAEPPCCEQYGLGSSYAQQYGTAWPLVFDGSCSGGSIKTVQEWLDFATLGWSTSPDGLCLADGFYTMSYDPAP